MSVGVLKTSDSRLLTVLAAHVVFPLRGVWSARIEVDADESAPVVPGKATLTLAADNDGAPATLLGTIREGDVRTFEGAATLILVGGAGALNTTELPAKTYQQAPLPVFALPLVEDAVSDAGEALAPTTAASLTGLTLPRWHRIAGTAAALLDRLAERLGVGWRLSDAGEVVMSAEAWPAADEDAAGLYVTGPDDGIQRTLEATVERTSIRPGTTVRGRRIEEAVYTLDAEGLSVVLRYGSGDGIGGLRGDMRAATRANVPALAYRELHAGVVRRQNLDGTLDIDCDDPTIGGVTSVPYKSGIVNSRLVIAEGQRVRVGFEDGDEARPFAIGLEPTGPLTGKGVARLDDTTTNGTLTFVGAPDGQGGILSISVTYTAPDGSTQTGAITSAGTPLTINLKGKIDLASTEVFIKGAV